MRKHLKRAFIVLIILSCLISIVIIIGAVMLYSFSKDNVSDEVIGSLRSDGKITFYRYERNKDGEIVNSPIEFECVSGKRTFSGGYVTFDQIPDDLIKAFVAIEDKRFYSHSGIDYPRSCYAIFNYLTGGKKCFGGSTITQQLVKNLTGDDHVLVKRKLSEAFAAMDLERRYDKTEILETYLNVINLARGCRGIADAAMLYYSKEVSDLNLCESATIAAITNNPARYDPISHPNDNKKRRNLILKCMLDAGYISPEEYYSAIDEELNLNVTEAEKKENVYSWYIDTVIEDVIRDLSEKYHVSLKTASDIFYQGGYKIYTAIDPDVQNSMESFYTDTNNFPTDSNGRHPQSSMIVIDPYSSDVLGVIGSIGQKKGNRLLNFATASKRPSGSAIKPLSVYAPALDKGLIQWSTVIEDSPIREGEGKTAPWPSNANNQYVGRVNIDYAIRNSLNTVAVKTLRQLGNSYSFDFLKNKLLINSLDMKKDMGDASLALGQHSTGITLRELVSAYSILTDGIMKKSRTYYKVTDCNGKIILDNVSSEKRVISEESAAIMTKLLQGVIEDGTASSTISLSDITEVAGKTGTTQFTFDKYFIGYTPTLLAGVWQGFEMPASLDFIGFNYSSVIWNEIIGDIYSSSDRFTRQSRFYVPATVQKLTFNEESGLILKSFDRDEVSDEGWFDIRKLCR